MAVASIAACDEVDDARHHAAEDHHQHRLGLVHSLEQAEKGQHQEDQHDRAKELADDAETEQEFVVDDIGGRGRGVPGHEQGVGNINEADGAEEGQQQIDQTCDPGVPAE
jgi:hypothetical protein